MFQALFYIVPVISYYRLVLGPGVVALFLHGYISKVCIQHIICTKSILNISSEIVLIVVAVISDCAMMTRIIPARFEKTP